MYDTIENSIGRLINDINDGVPLIIEGKKYFFTGFNEASSPEHAKVLCETLRTLLDGDEKALSVFNQSSDTISKFIKLKCKLSELETKGTYLEILVKYTREMITLFLEAKKIDLKKEMKNIKNIIKNDFNTTLTHDQHNEEDNDQLYKYVIFLANITGKNVKIWLNHIKNYEQQMFDKPTMHAFNKTINDAFANTNKQFNKQFTLTTAEIEKEIIIHAHMITLEAKITKYNLEVTIDKKKYPQPLEKCQQPASCDITVKYEQKDGEKNLTLKEFCVTSEMIEKLTSNTKNIKSEAIYIDNLLSIKKDLENSLNSYTKHWSSKSKFTKNWHQTFNFLAKKITTRKENIEIITAIIKIIDEAIKNAGQEISKGDNTNTSYKNNVTTQILPKINELRGKFKEKTYNQTVKHLLSEIKPSENNSITHHNDSNSIINCRLQDIHTQPKKTNQTKNEKPNSRKQTNKNGWSLAFYHNKTTPLDQIFNQIEKTATKIFCGCFPRFSK